MVPPFTARSRACEPKHTTAPALRHGCGGRVGGINYLRYSCGPHVHSGFGYTLKDGKLYINEEEANVVRLIFQRYLEIGSVNRLVKDLKERGFRSKVRQLASGGTRGGVPFTQGPLFYLLRNRFYLGEVKFKGEILPGSQPALLDRALFEAVQQRLTDPVVTPHDDTDPNPSPPCRAAV